MRVVVAPDKFKGSLTAAAAAEAIGAGLRRARPDTDVVLAPIADGGDGTVDAAVAAGYERVQVRVTGPTGEPVTASFALSGPTAVVEMAEASGLRRLPGGRPAPLTATTYGTGELIRAALDRGARRVVLGLGGSATTDGGTGMARVLGARFLDAAGRDLPPGGAALRDLATISLDGLDPRLRDMETAAPSAGEAERSPRSSGATKAETAPSAGEAERSPRSSGATKAEIVVASDVDNPLIGDQGAAAVYGPQKGAAPADVERLEQGLARLASVAADQLGVDLATMPGAGAAGGTGGGAVAFLGARLVSGIDLLLDLVRFPAAVAGADLVVTGEGSLDRQSLAGKAPWGVAQAAAKAGVPVVALVGRSTLTADEAAAAGFAEVHALTDVEPDLERCQRDAARLLALVAQRLAESSPRLGAAAEPRRQAHTA